MRRRWEKRGVKIPKIPRWLALLVFLLVAILASCIIYTSKSAYYQNWKTTNAVVVESKSITTGFGLRTVIYCSYTVNGKDYLEREILPQSALDDFSKGEIITIRYDPERPNVFICHEFNPGGEAMMIIFLVLPLLIGFIVKPGSNSIFK